MPSMPRRARQSKRSEQELQSKLDLPRSLRTCDPSHRRTNTSTWSIENGRVGEVDELGSELELVPFGEEEILEKPHIQACHPRSIHGSISTGPKRSDGSRGKRRGIEIL